MNFFVAGLSYKTAPVELREKLAVQASRLRCHGCRLKLAGDLSELVLVSTCNRVEIYGVSRHRTDSVGGLFDLLAGCDLDTASSVYVKHGVEALRHLFSVASGLDSMVIGETEITGQVKQAYQAAHEAGLTGRVLNRVFQTAFQTVKQVRTETGIGRGATSVGSVAVELADRIFDGDFKHKTVMIIGAGKMGEACVRHLTKKGAHAVLVVNRSLERAEGLARDFGGRAVALQDCLSAMVEADVVVSSTGSPDTILDASDISSVMAARRKRPLVLIDIAVPRDIEPDVQRLPNVYLYDVDDLQVIVQENVRLREQELERCRDIIRHNSLEVAARIQQAAPARRPASGEVSSQNWHPVLCAS